MTSYWMRLTTWSDMKSDLPRPSFLLLISRLRRCLPTPSSCLLSPSSFQTSVSAEIPWVQQSRSSSRALLGASSVLSQGLLCAEIQVMTLVLVARSEEVAQGRHLA